MAAFPPTAVDAAGGDIGHEAREFRAVRGGETACAVVPVPLALMALFLNVDAVLVDFDTVVLGDLAAEGDLLITTFAASIGLGHWISAHCCCKLWS